MKKNSVSEVVKPVSVHSKKRFHTGWFLAFVIPLLLVGAILFVISKLLYGVEYYSPTVELEKYVQAVKDKNYTEVMAYLDIETTEFNGLEEYTTFFEDYYGDKIDNYVFVERKLQETDTDVFYDVRINKKTVQKFKLTKTGEKKMYIFNTWKATLVDQIPKSSVIIHAVPGVNISVNGVAITSAHALEEPGYSFNFYSNIKDDNKTLTINSYQVNDLVAVSSVSAVNNGGEPCEITVLSDEENTVTYLVAAPIPADQVEAMKATTLEITKKYAEFIAKDESFGNLVPYLYTNTTFYDNLREFYNGWFTGHQSYGFENISYFALEYFDETHYRVGIEMDYFVYKSDVRYDYHIKYKVYLLKVGNKWLLADLSIQ